MTRQIPPELLTNRVAVNTVAKMYFNISFPYDKHNRRPEHDFSNVPNLTPDAAVLYDWVQENVAENNRVSCIPKFWQKLIDQKLTAHSQKWIIRDALQSLISPIEDTADVTVNGRPGFDLLRATYQYTVTLTLADLDRLRMQMQAVQYHLRGPLTATRRSLGSAVAVAGAAMNATQTISATVATARNPRERKRTAKRVAFYLMLAPHLPDHIPTVWYQKESL